MLIEFSVTNYRSIRDEQKLSLVATALDDHAEKHVVGSGAPGGVRLLRSAVIYGANAAGKSNLILAMGCMARIVRSSARKSQTGEPLPVVPFRLDASADGQTTFEIVFVADRVRYQYGFAATSSRVVEEWLSAFPEKCSQRWFHREYSAKTQNYTWTFGPQLKGQKQVWRAATRDNALFLSTAQLNAEQLRGVYEWFDSTLLVLPRLDAFPDLSTRNLLESGGMRAQIAALLRNADTGIRDVESVESTANAESAGEGSGVRDDRPASFRELRKVLGKVVLVKHQRAMEPMPGFRFRMSRTERSDCSPLPRRS
ncbi:AAA family ATPase [Tahibacter amnicola]|uniref:AAA family ATPase n=1 Tax=Tahibacter amnicola TaxID=2976241 RepID=A0ABY6BFA0_9GAMM|nr:AAA family ATPase [Tahibacter amnicola]UXI67948.1 AAA family ATPase [Tahibacter amnicola]